MTWWRRLTARGRASLLGGTLAAVTLGLVGQRGTLWVFATIALLPLLALLITSLFPSTISVNREVQPQRVQIGHQATVTLYLSVFPSRMPQLLTFEESVPQQLGRRPRFEGSQTFGRWKRQISYPVVGHARGFWSTGPLLVRSQDPFGMTRTDRAVPSVSEVIVTPEIWELSIPSLGQGSISGSDTSQRSIGSGGRSDVLIREHRQGDGLKHVHWKSSAKHGQLMVRQEERPLEPSVTVLLDSRASAFPGKDGAQRFEWAVSAATSIALHLIDLRLQVRIIDSDGKHSAPTHDSPAANSEELLMAMTAQQLSRSDDFESALRNEPNVAGEKLFIAILGRVTDREAVQLINLEPNTTGWVLLLDPSSNEDLRRQFSARNWRSVLVGPGESIQQVWSRMGDKL